MPSDYYSIITNNGLLKEAAANSVGAKVSLTHIAVGDSNGTSYEPVATQSALVHEVYRTTLTHAVIDEDNPNQLIIEGVISEEVGSFYIREVGIFASDGSLFAIGKYPDTYKPALPAGSGKRLYIRMFLGFTNSPQVNLIISNDINNDPNFVTTIINALAQKLAKAQNLADVEDKGKARTNLGLEIGTNIQAYSPNLATVAALIGDANKIPYFTGAGQMATINLFSNRNVIINGEYNIWQRGSSFLDFTRSNFIRDTGGSGYVADRWHYSKYGRASHDITRSTNVPSVAQAGRLFGYSMLLVCKTVEAFGFEEIRSYARYCSITHKVEGYNFLPLAQRFFTLSFWVKATKTGIYCVGLKNAGNDRSYVAEYTVNQPDTWEFKIITVPPSPDSGTWDYTNGTGLAVVFALASDSKWKTTPNSWQVGDYFATANQVNACDSTSNRFSLCGVQLEAGSVATPFESRTIQQESLLCQRYFQKSYPMDIVPQTLTGEGILSYFADGVSMTQGGQITYSPEMRTTPTMTVYSPTTGLPGVGQRSDGAAIAFTGMGGHSSRQGRFYFTPGQPTNTWINWHYTASAEL